MPLSCVELHVIRDDNFEPVSFDIFFRGTDTAGIPFFTAETEVDPEDVMTTVDTELTTNATTWGITDDIT